MLKLIVNICLILGLLTNISTVLAAGIILDRSIIDFSSTEPPRHDVTVINQGDEMAYVKVEVLEVLNPGTEKEERIIVTNPEQIQFVASPSKLAIPPGGRKQVRLVNLAPPGKEKIFRVNFTPVLPPLEVKTEGLGVTFVVAYQVLALIHPADPTENLIIEREPNSISFDNQGNTYALISNVRQCDKNGENCQDDLGSKRLYAGNNMMIPLPYTDTPVTYKLTNFKGSREETIQ
jgi:Mat/Ecp fimbriae periplasmic chaperone